MSRALRLRNATPVALGALVLWSAILSGASGGTEPSPDPSPQAHAARCPGARAGLDFYRSAWTRWHRQTGASVAKPAGRPRWCGHARRLAAHWRVRSLEARHRFEGWLARTYRKWECVHLREARWTDDGAPYYGGLQFDSSFERAYGRHFLARWGHAGNWPVWAQLVAAERGHRDRGWSPWPNTARACGLR